MTLRNIAERNKPLQLWTEQRGCMNGQLAQFTGGHG